MLNQMCSVVLFSVSAAEPHLLPQNIRAALFPGGSQRRSHADLDGRYSHGHRRTQQILSRAEHAGIRSEDNYQNTRVIITVTDSALAGFHIEMGERYVLINIYIPNNVSRTLLFWENTIKGINTFQLSKCIFNKTKIGLIMCVCVRERERESVCV